MSAKMKGEVLCPYQTDFKIASNGLFHTCLYNECFNSVEALKGLKLKMFGHNNGPAWEAPLWSGFCYTNGDFHHDTSISVEK